MTNTNYMQVIEPIHDYIIRSKQGNFFYEIKEYEELFSITFHERDEKLSLVTNKMNGYVLNNTDIKKREIKESGLTLLDYLNEFLKEFIQQCEHIYIEKKNAGLSDFAVLVLHISEKTF